MHKEAIKLKEIDFNITNRCNLKCDICSFDSNNILPEEVSIECIKKTLIEGKNLGLEDLHLTGGEPLIRKDICEVIAFAVSIGLNLRILTNGTLASKQRLIKYRNLGVKKIMFSLDGFEETHDRRRQVKGAYRKTVKAVWDALDLGYDVRINMVACSDNIREIPRFIELWRDTGIKTFSIFLFSPIGRGKALRNLEVDPYAWKHLYVTLKKIAQDNDDNSGVNIVLEKGYLWPEEYNTRRIVRKELGGRSGALTLATKRDYLLITSDGEVWPCVFFVYLEAPSLGNIRNQSLSDILFKSRSWEFYYSLSIPPKECEVCPNWDICCGGCKGYAMTYTGRWSTPDPRCRYKTKKGETIIPLCPMIKENLYTSKIESSSEAVME